MSERPPKRSTPTKEGSRDAGHRRRPARRLSPEEIKKLKDEVTRRALFEFAAGGVIAGGVTGLGFKLYDVFRKLGASDEEAQALSTKLHEHDASGRVTERLRQMSASPLFYEQLGHFMRYYREHGDLELALSYEHGRARTVDDSAGRSRIDYVREEVMNGVTNDTIPETIRTELSFYAVGMYATETKYQRDLESYAGAVGLGQHMPETYALYGKTEEQMRYLIHQVDVTRMMFIDYYRMMQSSAEKGGIREALEKICADYFSNNQEAFEREFLALCLVNAYQVGIGNMMTVIRKFSQLPLTNRIHSYDVFEMMTSLAKDGSVDPSYRTESYNYAKQASAFAFLLATSDTQAES